MTPELSEQTAAAVVALLTFLTVIYNGYRQSQTARKTDEINDAVNNRHLRKDYKGNVPPKLYDLAIDNHMKITELAEWKDGYANSPLANPDDIIGFCYRLDEIEKSQKQILDHCFCVAENAEEKNTNIQTEEE